MSLETKIDIVVKNLNQLNKLSENLKGINASNEKLVKGLDQINSKLDRIGGKGFTGLKRSADSASKSVSSLSKNVSVFERFSKSGNNAAGRAMGLGAFGAAAIGADKLAKSYNGLVAQNGLAVKALGLTTFKAQGLSAAFMGLGSLMAAHPQIAGGVAVALTALGIKGFEFVAKKAFAAGGALRQFFHTNTEITAQLPQTQKEYDKLANSFEHAHLHAKNLEDAMKRIRAAGNVGMKGNIVRNVGRSKASRAGSGFADFSRRADQVMNTPSGRPKGMFGPNRPGAEDAVTKSIRRHLELEAKRTGVVRQTWDIEKKIVEFKKKGEQVTKREGAAAKKTARERLQNIRRIRRRKGGMGGKGGENLMLGAGFPLLFGGGVGSVGGGVGGALLGNKMGMQGFGAQILGSAIGTMMDTAVQKAAKLGEALRTVSMDELVESGVRLSAELQTQITLLTRAGDIEKARALAAQQVQKQTGASAGSLQDINNAANILKSAWNDIVGSVGAFLGVIASPVLAALGLVLRLVSEIFKSFNQTFGLLRKGIVGALNFIAPGLNDMISGVMDGLNPALQESIAKATELGRKFRENASLLLEQLKISASMPTGNTFADQQARVGGKLKSRLLGFNKETQTKLGDLRADNQGASPAAMKTLEKDFMADRNMQKAGIISESVKEMAKINEQEQQVIGKLERQNELKAAVLGIDKKIAQAKVDENKELEFRLEAEKQKASIISKSMETAANAKSEEAKILGLKQTEVELNRVNFELETKIDAFRQKKKDEAEDVLTQLQNENNLLQGKIDGNEEEIQQHQVIEKIVDKIGEGYRTQVTALVNKNGELTKEAENTKKLEAQWKKIKETIATGMTDAIMGLIDGTKSLGESLAGIAKQIASMMIKKAIFGAFSLNAEGGYKQGGFQAFASGGMVTKPTMGMVGEAGEDEYIIPASKMAQSMQRYSAGARGESVIPGTGQSSSGGASGSSTTVNYSGPILNFNSEEFVPKSAVGQIINSAASKGASAGEARTLSTLRNSRSTRSRIGM